MLYTPFAGYRFFEYDGKNVDQIVEIANRALKILLHWSESNSLRVNTRKQNSR